jgi:hypothetical protein
MDRAPAVSGGCASRAVPALWCREPADGSRPWPPRSWASGPRGLWPTGRRRGSRSSVGVVSTISLRRRHVSRGHLGRAAWRRTTPALQSRGDRDGDDVVGDHGDASGSHSEAGLRVAEYVMGDGVVDTSPMGARGTRTRGPSGRGVHVARGRCACRADRDRSCATVAADRAARGASMCRSYRTVVMSIAVCSLAMTGPPTWIVVGA